MSTFFLILAAVISTVGMLIHVTRGRRLIVQPLLDANLAPVPTQTLVFSWHWGAITMAILAISYLAPVWRADLLPLAMMATFYSYCLGALSLLTMRKQKFNMSQMPQWILFWSVSLFGLIAWGVL